LSQAKMRRFRAVVDTESSAPALATSVTDKCSPVPARPSPPADLHQSSQRISLRPTMFRATCDKRVTTSQPASRPTANRRISKCPPANPMCTKPDRANRVPCSTNARQRLIAPHHDSPFIGIATPCGHARVLAVRQLATLELAARTISAHSAARPPPIHRP
jgi:hypothetical protein